MESTQLVEQQLPATANLHRTMTAGELTKQALLIQEILEKVMVGPSEDNPAGVHYGLVPGTKKPTLLQPGAEKICATFRLAPKYAVEDLSEPHQNFYRYRVACNLYTIAEGLFVGSACGEASSAEEKYQWEKVLCDEQWEMTDPTARRIKFKKRYKSDEVDQIQQIRTNAADISNTVLKIACKRAYVSATRSATAASDLLEVDLEEPKVAELVQAEQEGLQPAEAKAAKPKAKAKPVTFPYGQAKGKDISDPTVELSLLEWFADTMATAIKDDSKKSFLAQNRAFLLALDVEIAKRKGLAGPGQAETGQNPSKAQPSEAQTPAGDVVPVFTDSTWADFILWCEEEAPATYASAKTHFHITSGHDIAKAADRHAFFQYVKANTLKR